ncbi:MAG: hypothetical protein AAF840_00580 [Bacteroidota bacterium]
MQELIDWLYVYCTDFIINLANLLGWSYYEVNVLIFCFGYPVLLGGAIMLYTVQRRRWNRLKSEIELG